MDIQYLKLYCEVRYNKLEHDTLEYEGDEEKQIKFYTFLMNDHKIKNPELKEQLKIYCPRMIFQIRKFFTK